jgi:hypothetical protein
MQSVADGLVRGEDLLPRSHDMALEHGRTVFADLNLDGHCVSAAMPASAINTSC